MLTQENYHSTSHFTLNLANFGGPPTIVQSSVEHNSSTEEKKEHDSSSEHDVEKE